MVAVSYIFIFLHYFIYSSFQSKISCIDFVSNFLPHLLLVRICYGCVKFTLEYVLALSIFFEENYILIFCPVWLSFSFLILVFVHFGEAKTLTIMLFRKVTLKDDDVSEALRNHGSLSAHLQYYDC